jgi:fimbrial chaperone protein
MLSLFTKKVLSTLVIFSMTGFVTHAASLQVSPILVDLEAEKSSTSVITLRNSSDGVVNAQVRVFKWSQENGADVFDETSDVVASPPIIKLNAQGSNVIRVVRVKNSAPVGEESYRLIIDELPNGDKKAGTIAMLVRHSVPMFFSTARATNPEVTWSLTRKAGKLQVKAVNVGDKRLRLANLTGTSGGATIDFGRGLNGYVLGRSTLNLTSKSNVGTIAGSVTLKADTHMEQLNVSVPLK